MFSMFCTTHGLPSLMPPPRGAAVKTTKGGLEQRRNKRMSPTFRTRNQSYMVAMLSEGTERTEMQPAVAFYRAVSQPF